MNEWTTRIERKQRALAAPPEGRRVPLRGNEEFAVVLQRHERRESLVAVTLLRKRGVDASKHQAKEDVA